MNCKITIGFAILTAICVQAAFGGVQRERLADGWEFMRADGSASETNSAAWRAVRVPHDWGVEKSFDPKKPYGDAYLEPTGIGWYRSTFRLDPARAAFIKAGGLLFFESNGMMSHSKVWVNGTYVGGWPYGYTAFRCDLTPHLLRTPPGHRAQENQCARGNLHHGFISWIHVRHDYIASVGGKLLFSENRPTQRGEVLV